MDKNIISILCIFVFSMSLSGQMLKSDDTIVIKNNNYTETIESYNYIIERDTVWSKTCSIHNISNDTLWVMFEKDDRLSNDYDMVHHRFFYSKPEIGRLRAFSYLLDGNVNFTFDLFNVFFKLVLPNRSFNIIIEGESVTEIDFLISKIRIIPQSFIFDNFRLIKRSYTNFDNQVFYTKDNLLITRQILKHALQE